MEFLLFHIEFSIFHIQSLYSISNLHLQIIHNVVTNVATLSWPVILYEIESISFS